MFFGFKTLMSSQYFTILENQLRVIKHEMCLCRLLSHSWNYILKERHHKHIQLQFSSWCWSKTPSLPHLWFMLQEFMDGFFLPSINVANSITLVELGCQKKLQRTPIDKVKYKTLDCHHQWASELYFNASCFLIVIWHTGCQSANINNLTQPTDWCTLTRCDLIRHS